jgi:serine/threonine-protein kinase
MHQQHAEDPTTERMFLDEARLALCLVHPNIVRSERLGSFDGRHGIVMEFLEGQPLHQVLKRAYELERTFSLELVVQIALAALDGLHYAHELKDVVGNHLGLVHRDVSPQNIFLTYEGAVKLLDFGIAKNAMQDGRTRTGLLKGKVAYMAPEQARGDGIDRRADIWSLGVVLWEAVTGSRLFKGSNEAATLNLTLSEEVASPRLRRPDLPPELEAILMRALERDPARRYATAAAMRDDLEAWLAERDGSAEVSISQLMQRLFAREMREQKQQIAALLQAQPEAVVESGVTRFASSGTTFASLPATQLSSVTDLMNELGRQRRATTRLLGGLLFLVACALILGIYWTVGQRPKDPQVVASTASLTRASHGAPSATQLTNTTAPASPALGSGPATSVAEAGPTRRSAATPAGWRASSGSSIPKDGERRGPAGATASAIAAPAPAPQTAPAAAAEPGFLNLDTTPWSNVSVGGRTLGATPLVGASLPAGTHTLVLTNPELGIKTTYQVTIAAGRTTARRIGLE